ncbi:MAG: HD domain-containing protein [Bacillota bacterium]|nr:HD domain-containing protein [Bacillota bacterium]
MIVQIAKEIENTHGKAYYAGGYVRDFMLGEKGLNKDIDIEVFGLTTERLMEVLVNFGEPRQVGKAFPVIKLKGHHEWDFTIPSSPECSLAEACHRRDFMINSMLMNIITREIIDSYGGQEDLRKGVIYHTSEEVFAEDPLRAYRAIQFVGRFGFELHPDTAKLIQKTELGNIHSERIYEELRKLLLLSPKPSLGLAAMRETDMLQWHPLLEKLIGCEQSPINHPEGDVWIHTLMVVDEAAHLRSQSEDPEAYMFAALLHDLGKPGTTCVRDGKITAYGHDVEGEPLARAFMKEITANRKLIDKIALLVREHMNPILLFKQRDRVGDKAIRKLVNRVNLKELLLLSEADYKGRDVPRDYEEIRGWFEHRLDAIGLSLNSQIEPLVRGRDLLEMGFSPGIAFTQILDEAFEYQMEGHTREEIMEKLTERYKNTDFF